MPYVRSRAPGYILRRRGIGDLSYTSTSTPFGDYQTVTDSSTGSQTIFDPNGNVVSSIPTSFSPFYGPVQPGSPTYVPTSSTSPVGTPAGLPAGSLTSFFQQYQTPILIGVFVVLGLSILGKR